MQSITIVTRYVSEMGRTLNEFNKKMTCSACHLVCGSEPSKRSEGDYPEDAIYEARLDQKHENFLRAPKIPTLSEMRAQCLVVLPGVGGYLS